MQLVCHQGLPVFRGCGAWVGADSGSICRWCGKTLPPSGVAVSDQVALALNRGQTPISDVASQRP